jgi:uncharacterized membrane protein
MPEPDEPPPSSGGDSLSPRARRMFFDLRFAGGRVIASGIVGVFATLLTPRDLPFRVRAVVGWDSGALVFAVLAWIMILRASPGSTRSRAALEDPGRRLVFALALMASIFSLFAAVVVIREIRTLSAVQVPIWTGLALAAVVLSWVVTHTVFTLRYAHLYYRRHATTHCLQFPGKEPPCDLDFAYFAFTIGMCFQVSDVVILTSRARRTVLLHSVMSFVYNTTILALSLNLITTLLS